jgi:hypothetical protein
MSSHLIEIDTARDRHIAALRESFATDADPWNTSFLDVEIFVSLSYPERRIAELLLGCGGPTVWLSVDQHDHVRFHHSWGCALDGSDQDEIAVYGEDADFIVSLVESYVECRTDAEGRMS